MFEVGFSELLLIMALSLIVLGPEKLPKVASQVGRWMGRARAMARQFRETLEEEVQLEPTIRRPGTASSGSSSAGAAASSPASETVATSAAAAGGLAASASTTTRPCRTSPIPMPAIRPPVATTPTRATTTIPARPTPRPTPHPTPRPIPHRTRWPPRRPPT